MPNLKQIFVIHWMIILSCAIALYFLKPDATLAFVAGGLLASVNFALLASFWRRTLDKKPVATIMLLIVIKYAVLGVALYVLIKILKFELIPLFAGVATLGGSFLVGAFRSRALTK